MMAVDTGLDGRTALVTGASGGLGAHFARVLARAGARVVVAARREARCHALADELRADGGEAIAVALDVTDTAAIDAALDRVAERFGAVDVLVNNAGVVERGKSPRALADHAFAEVVAVNLTAVYAVSQRVAERLIDAGRPGAIVNIASLLSFATRAGVPAYCASKAGVAHLTEQMALELAPHGIRVNALAPGYFKTDLNREMLESEVGERLVARVPQRRLGRMEDLDGPLLLLAGDAGRYMTGAVVPVDGGHRVAGV
jgi:NAD(P)-dependent dehydrogenase (short-subunit alcohol dehydrogenase family)